MLKKIALVVAVLLIALLVFAATRPDSFQIQREIVVKAPAEKIFPLITDFHNWTAWSPWEKMDPALKRTYSGAATGKGAVYEWQGNSKVGQGRMEISGIAPTSEIAIKLDFVAPFEAHNVAEFTLDSEGASTRVNWIMRGPSPYIAKVMGIFFSMDAMVGKDFEAGLANLKSVAEK